MKKIFSLLLPIVLTACGGGGSSDSSTTTASTSTPTSAPAASSSAPGGLYIGYYQEDSITNPEDPMPGALYLNLPSGDAAFSGNMYFTYLGCQTSNLGTISGNKSGTSLVGNWTGTIDGSAQSGSYSGTYDAAAGRYSGTYTNAAGKQFRDLRPCIQYYIAPNGTWELFPVEQNTPSTFSVNVSGSTVSWTPPAGTESTFIAVFDATIAESGGPGNAIKLQTILGNVGNVNLAGGGLVTGHNYIVAITTADSSDKRISYGSKRFIAP